MMSLKLTAQIYTRRECIKSIRCRSGLIYQSTVVVGQAGNAGGYMLAGEPDKSASLTPQSLTNSCSTWHDTTASRGISPVISPSLTLVVSQLQQNLGMELVWSRRLLNYFAWDCFRVDTCGRHCVSDAILDRKTSLLLIIIIVIFIQITVHIYSSINNACVLAYVCVWFEEDQSTIELVWALY